MSVQTLPVQDLRPAGRPAAIAPGLLHVFRMAAVLRLAFVALIAILVVAWQIPAQLLTLVILAESALLVAALSWPAVATAFGAFYLPVMLGWALIGPLLMRLFLAAGYLSAVRGGVMGQSPLPGGLTDYDLFVGAGFNLAWLAVPVVLAAWQYGRRGLNITMTIVVAGNLLAVFLPTSTEPALAALLVDLAGRLAIIGLVAIVVERLAAAQRAEQAALEQANRRLVAQAATVEQLAESRERNRLARELHDTLAHALTGLSVQLQALGRLMATDPAAAQVQLKAAQATVRDGIQEARRAIQALRAAPLTDLGLSEALRQLCRNFAERQGIAVDCQIEDVGALDPLAEQTVYRIAEAALANVEQHAEAANVTVRLTHAGDTLTLLVRDDGAGFDPATVSADRYGVAGMRERAVASGGYCTVSSGVGQGTEIRLVLPR